MQIPYRSHQGTPLQQYHAFAVKQNTTLYPGDELVIPVPPSMQCSAINVTLRRGFEMCNPVIKNAKKTHITLSNNSNQIVYVPKHTHLADLRICTKIDSADKNDTSLLRIYDISDDNISHLLQPESTGY